MQQRLKRLEKDPYKTPPYKIPIQSLLLLLLPLVILLSSMPLALGKAWQDTRPWNDKEELAYSNWIKQLGNRSWKSVHQLLHNQKVNNLYQPSDRHLVFQADCGDLPFVLRSYYAYKRQLPIIIPIVKGGNYSPTPNPTIALVSNRTFEGNVRDFFIQLPEMVNTATLRTHYTQRDTACYPLALNRKSIKPGCIFYDPNGHAAVVCAVEIDGTVRLIDAHPDQSITRTMLGPKLHWRTSSHVGGFLRFRPVKRHRGALIFENQLKALPAFSTEQYSIKENYHITTKLKLAGVLFNPIKDLEQYIRHDTYREALDRVEAVQRGWNIAKHTQISVPPNIYYASGPWEQYSTPGRDIRLRLSFLNIPSRIKNYIAMSQQQPEKLVISARNPDRLLLQLIKTQESLFKKLTIKYLNSDGKYIPLSLYDIERRLFLLSFNPNHPPELRWGAKGKELSSAYRSRPRYYANYIQEQPWRNRLKTKLGVMSPTDFDNPKFPPKHNVTHIIRKLKK